MSVRAFYADWAGYNRRVVEGVRALPLEALELRVPDSDHWPVWRIVGHMGRARIWWLCAVFGEAGADRTPFNSLNNEEWVALGRPASAASLADDFATSWSVVSDCLDRWTPERLTETQRETEAGHDELHTRQSILLRLITHEAYHVGEINLALGVVGYEPIDLWPGDDWAVGAPASLREG
ncbi:MAG TPA: DinB family protein [Candidatus Limnocylindrales bacterium]|nr:DinB family protein [Candidatus Limnocylindrales bacterium]